MAAGSEHLKLPEGIATEAWEWGRRPAAASPRGRLLRRLQQPWRELVARYPARRLLVAGGSLGIVALIVAAFALGGGTGSRAGDKTAAVGNAGTADSGGAEQQSPSTTGLASGGGSSTHGLTPTAGVRSSATGSAPSSTGAAAPRFLAPVPRTPLPEASSTAASGTSTADAGGVASSGVTGTRVVKTGQLSLTVHKGLVASTITKLTTATTRLGGYVAQSHTEDLAGSPSGSLTLRVPVGDFESAVAAATALGHETSLATSAHDVTGKFVDLTARLHALKRTRSTYLTILSRARTIGQTLSVQQRVNDIQQQIEQLQGELKVLRNQSADATLTVDVAEAGSGATKVIVHHRRGGFSKAWHTSVHRFNRGIQAIIGALGPLLLALIALAVLYAVVRILFARTRRSGPQAG